MLDAIRKRIRFELALAMLDLSNRLMAASANLYKRHLKESVRPKEKNEDQDCMFDFLRWPKPGSEDHSVN